MAREADGEKLEHIAAAEGIPAERVRQRVSRLRRWMRARWMAELAAAAALALVAAGAWRFLSPSSETILPEAVGSGVRESSVRETWRLVSFAPARPLGAVQQALFDRAHEGLVVRFDGRTITATFADPALARRYLVTSATGRRVELTETSGRGKLVLEYGLEGDQLAVTASGGTWAGVARLRESNPDPHAVAGTA